MKQSENNEIDSLLRSLARRPPWQSRPGRLSDSSAHLDADELNAYAEGALPSTTRARYTAHLADCNDCRKIVVELSLAAGPLIEERKLDQVPATSSNWTSKLWALLSPRVLRFAMPAIALAVIAVAFFALRPSQRESLVAHNENPTPVSASATPAETSKSGNGALKSSDGSIAPTESPEHQKVQSSQPSTSTPRDKSEVAAEKKADGSETRLAKGTEPAVGKAEETVVVNQSGQAVADQKIAQTQSAGALRPGTAPAKSAAANTETRQTKDGRAAEEQNAERETIQQKELDRAERKAGEVAQQNKGGPRRNEMNDKAKPSRGFGVTSQAGGRDDDSATRTVAGRRFKQRNGVWVDTAYNSSLSLTSVGRGSEQYRALIADEPVIRTVAEALSGEVIVVLKGHAYRIH